MNQQKLKTWMHAQEFPLVACVYDQGYYGGKTFRTPDPQGFDVFPDAYTAQHEVARSNWEQYIDSFPEYADEPAPKLVSLAESLGGTTETALLPKTRKRTKA